MEKGNSTGDLLEEYHGPSWTTIRSNYWKNEAKKPGALSKWGEKNIQKMLKGKSPKKNDKKIILHHPYGRNGKNIENFIEMPENEHIQFHIENGYRYDISKGGWH